MQGNAKRIYAWALYDWANSAFATTVMAGFFPAFFKQYWSSGVDESLSTLHLGLANSLSSAVVVLVAPLLGAIADRSNRRRRFLAIFAFTGALMTGCLYLVEQGDWPLAALVYVLATIGFSLANTFYDSLLGFVAPRENVDAISALGYGMGYLGGGLLFAANPYAVLHPQAVGLSDPSEAVRWSFLSVALWWMLFSLPILLFVKDDVHPRQPSGWNALVGGYRQLRETLSHIRQLPHMLTFLLAYWFYIDGVDTVVRMAVDYGLSLGFGRDSLLTALLVTQLVGFPSAIAFGTLGTRIGTRRSLFIGIAVYVGVTVWAYFIAAVWEFYAIAVVIGLVQGGVQALSRSLYHRLIPPGKSAEFFGFYNMLGKSAAVLGPALMGWTSVLLGSPRASILSILVLFIAGALLLSKVDLEQGQREAQAFAA